LFLSFYTFGAYGVKSDTGGAIIFSEYVTMPKMTDEEADALDEYYTQNTIMPDPGKA
jgi:hypothetical protein